MRTSDTMASTSTEHHFFIPNPTAGLCRILSVLLQYPTEELVTNLPAIRDAVYQLAVPQVQDALESFIEHLDGTDLMALQEDYTRTFDLTSDTSMHLTYHVCGHSAERGMALAELKRLYRTEGYEIAASELPDFLPLMLEFISVCDCYSHAMLLARFGDPIRQLAERLGERASPYAHLVAVVSVLHSEPSRAGK